MTVTGVYSYDNYYLFNPLIFQAVDVEGDLKLKLEVQGQSFNLTYKPIGGFLRFDLSIVIKGIISDIQNKNSIFGEVDGSFRVKMTFNDDNDQTVYEKNFILGGNMEFNQNNVPLLDNNLNTHHYFWYGYPDWDSVFDNGQIKNNPISRNSKYGILPAHDCENVFLAFRNRKGGFSKYLFESFEEGTNNRTDDVYFTDRNLKVTGVQTTRTLRLQSKVKREFYDTITQLCESIEIYWMPQVDKLMRLTGDNSVSFNKAKPSTIVTLQFEVVTDSIKVL